MANTTTINSNKTITSTGPLVVHIGHGASLADAVCAALSTSAGATGNNRINPNTSSGSVTNGTGSVTLPLMSEVQPIITLSFLSSSDGTGAAITAPLIIAAATSANISDLTGNGQAGPWGPGPGGPGGPGGEGEDQMKYMYRNLRC
jgi:hypothetical protein